MALCSKRVIKIVKINAINKINNLNDLVRFLSLDIQASFNGHDEERTLKARINKWKDFFTE